MKKILLDTSILIDFSRRHDKKATVLFKLLQAGYGFYISIVTHTEVYSGKSIWEEKEAEREAEDLFSGMQILPLETGLSKRAGQIKAHYEGTIIDSIVAATALEHGLELVTLNIKDFDKIKGLRLFKEIYG